MGEILNFPVFKFPRLQFPRGEGRREGGRGPMTDLGTVYVISGPMRGLNKLHPMAQTHR